MEIVVNRIIWYSPPHASNLLFMNILWKQGRLNPNKKVVVFQMPIVVSVAAAMGSDWRSFIRKFHWVGQQQQQQWWGETWRKTWRSSSKVILRSGRDLPWEEVPLKWKRRETCKGRTVTTTNKPIHHGKKIFSPFHIAQIAGKTCDGGFYLLCFPGNGVKNEPTSWYDRTSPFYFAIRKLTTEVLKNVMTPTQRNFSLLWSKY